MIKKLNIGTRGSELALAQTRLVTGRLKARQPEIEIEIKIIKTRGDDRAVEPIDLRAGRKGLFTGEIERALIDGEIDIAVHSAKDLPSNLTPGTAIAAVLPRAAVADVLIIKKHRPETDGLSQSSLDSLPRGSVVATGSVRRQRQLSWQRRDLQVVDLRGNVPTRLRKLQQSDWKGVVLAKAGLERLGIDCQTNSFTFEENSFSIMSLAPEIFLPAGGQGVIAIQSRANESNSLLREADDLVTHSCLRAEREFLRLLDADCNQPVGVLATIDQDLIKIRAQIFDDGKPEPRVAMVEGNRNSPEKLAGELFEKLKG